MASCRNRIIRRYIPGPKSYDDVTALASAPPLLAQIDAVVDFHEFCSFN